MASGTIRFIAVDWPTAKRLPDPGRIEVVTGTEGVIGGSKARVPEDDKAYDQECVSDLRPVYHPITWKVEAATVTKAEPSGRHENLIRPPLPGRMGRADNCTAMVPISAATGAGKATAAGIPGDTAAVTVVSSANMAPSIILRASPACGPRIEAILGLPESGQPPLPVIGREAVRRAHFKPRRPARDFTTQSEKEKALQESEFEALLPLMPAVLVVNMIGGDLGLQQVPTSQRYQQLRRRLLKRAGATGDNLAEVRLGLGTLREYAQVVMQAEPGHEDEILWPMSLGLAHEIANDEHERAVQKAAGSQGGATVAWHFRGVLVRLQKWGCPIEATPKQLDEIVPNGKPNLNPRRKAGAYTLGAHCQFELFAADPANVPLESPAAREIVSFRCRSKLAFGTAPSLRLGAEGARVQPELDHEHPHVITGTAYLTKDGAPLQFFAPAEGLLGEYTWYAEHYENVIRTGIPFPAWRSEWGAAGSILKAKEMRLAVGDSSALRRADREILTLPPLAMSSETLEELNPNGHSDHVTYSDWSRTIGQRPWFGTPLPDGLEDGFTDCDGGDSEALGNWMRSDATKASAVAQLAIRDARAAAGTGADARVAAARATAAAQKGARRKMRVYYGQSGALANRTGERAKQLDVRQRLIRTVREVLQMNCPDWRLLPSGLADTNMLRSVRGRNGRV